MPNLAPALTVTEISTDHNTVTVDDTTGTYDVADNPGGYGTPNADRADFVAPVYAFQYERDLEEDTALTIVNPGADPTTDAQWQITTARDGYLYITMLLIEPYSASVDYAVDAITAISLGGGIYGYYKALAVNGPSSSVVTPGTDAAVWEAVSITAATLSELSTIEDLIPSNRKVTLHYVQSTRGRECFANEISWVSNPSGCCKQCRKDAKWISLDVQLQAIFINCDRLLYTDADLNARQLQVECEALACTTCRTAK